MYYRQWRPYVPVAQRRRNARAHVKKLQKKGNPIQPIEIEGRTIAKTFWGKAWCDNMECYSDYENRLPRGRTYVRNGSVVHLQIARGKIEAIVSGSELYNVTVDIKPASKLTRNKIKKKCVGSIDSLMDLLHGRFSDSVMQALTQQAGGLFPVPKNIAFRCSCPDWADLCKHVAAVLYGIGARLDDEPELLFVLRGVDHLELISHAAEQTQHSDALTGSAGHALDSGDLSDVFGIELDAAPDSPSPGAGKWTGGPRKRKAASSRRVAAKKNGSRKPKKKVAKKRAKAVTTRTPAAKKSASKKTSPAGRGSSKAAAPKTRFKKPAKKR